MVGSRLRDARKAKGLTQKEVAAHFRMTQQQYSRFENGVFELNYGQIIELCLFYNITPNELFGFDELSLSVDRRRALIFLLFTTSF